MVLDALSAGSLAGAPGEAIWPWQCRTRVMGIPRAPGLADVGLEGQVVNILGFATTRPCCLSRKMVACQLRVSVASAVRHILPSPSLYIKQEDTVLCSYRDQEQQVGLHGHVGGSKHTL